MQNIVYRGSNNIDNINKKSVGIWVTEDREFAKQYGAVKKYIISDKLNLLEIISVEANILANKFLKADEDNDSFLTDIWYEPPKTFINFLLSKGYNGFINDNNILIFNKKDLKPC